MSLIAAARLCGFVLAAGLAARADPAPAPGEAPAGVPAEERFSLHYQATIATQAHPAFSAAYTGANSMKPEAESATSVVSDLFLGARLLPGVELYAQPELVGGFGLSTTLGVAAFPSGEVYRVGNPAPNVFIGRLFARVVLGLGGESRAIEGGPGRVGGARDANALTLTAGKISVPDFMDNVEVSNDPHTRFMSWGLWASAAYDYPADTHGYTWGAAADLTLGEWSARAGVFLEPKAANGIELEWDPTRARGIVAEVERRFSVGGRPGAARVLGFLNRARMGSYQAALAAGADVIATRADGRAKAGIAASLNQELARGLAGFLRLSWSDGKNETWAFTEIDHSAALGILESGAAWGRPLDEAGVAVVVSGLSQEHSDYLRSGKTGFIIGDGGLRPGPEILGEIFYRLALSKEVAIGGNYQPIVDPGFNRDRGPIHVFTARAHVAF